MMPRTVPWSRPGRLGERPANAANAAAASCLRHPTCTGGVGSAAEIRELALGLSLREE